MFNPEWLDEREKVIFRDADSYISTAFLGRGNKVRLGPFATEQDALDATLSYLRSENGLAVNKPFSLYAVASVHSHAQVVLYNVTRDGPQPTRAELMQKLQEQRSLAAKSRRRSKSERTA